MKNAKEYTEKVYAGVSGKIIGVFYGRPIEGWPYEKIREKFDMVDHYVNQEVGVPLHVGDDDLAGTFTFLNAAEDFQGNPAQLKSEDFGRTWMDYIIENKTIFWWGGLGRSTEHTAYLRLKSGILAPKSGAIETNGQSVAEQIGAQIFMDAYPMMCPKDPEKARYLVKQCASVSHDGIAVESACLIAAMEAMAFGERDLYKLIDIGTGFSKDTRLLKIVDSVRNETEKTIDFAVTDDDAPVITLKNGADVTLNYGSDFNLSDYVDVTDNFDGVVQPQVEGSIDNHKEDGVQTLTIKATDSSGNESSAQLNVAVKDTEAPKISLSKSEVSVNVGASLDLSNYLSSATDNKDGDVKGKVSIPSVSTSKAGSYTATYTVSDAAGNQGSASLTVKVNAVRTSSKKGSAVTGTTSRPNYYGTSVVGAAYSRLGCPYVWGAEGPNTFDCSGLVKWCYAKAGKSLPHSSSAMKSSGTVISISSAQPGDILWRPGHVAIYIGGNQYIHAPQTGDVVKVSSGVSSFTCAIRP